MIVFYEKEIVKYPNCPPQLRGRQTAMGYLKSFCQTDFAMEHVEQILHRLL